MNEDVKKLLNEFNIFFSDNSFFDFNFDSLLIPIDKYRFLPSIISDEKELTYKLQIPGFEKKDVKITIQNKTLKIKGKRISNEKRKYLINNEFWGDFEKNFELPDNVSTKNVVAKLENGILEIIFKKKDKEKPSQSVEIL